MSRVRLLSELVAALWLGEAEWAGDPPREPDSDRDGLLCPPVTASAFSFIFNIIPDFQTNKNRKLISMNEANVSTHFKHFCQ
jgi:hypothetical protein